MLKKISPLNFLLTTRCFSFNIPLESSMVDVSAKKPTVRLAETQCTVRMNLEAYTKLKSRQLAKGDALTMAEIAGIMAAKKTSDMIPLCHQIAMDYVKLHFTFLDESQQLQINCIAQVTDKTGCEMEAMVGASVAALTVYDMCKGIDKGIVIEEIKLISKSGGKSGDYRVSDR
ncbi:hypothetical protein FGO68_gene17434 [Halteria grandinella]|uniref:cyclic pyranopterin monophosphate synthase n=1 Tax=Halteria grandinella TaxID=5974 RepID=A0A8J8NP08_HALGN|nr:hypothetical protein FGO68_gene17434 [Halteria grandinella]